MRLCICLALDNDDEAALTVLRNDELRLPNPFSRFARRLKQLLDAWVGAFLLLNTEAVSGVIPVCSRCFRTIASVSRSFFIILIIPLKSPVLGKGVQSLKHIKFDKSKLLLHIRPAGLSICGA